MRWPHGRRRVGREQRARLPSRRRARVPAGAHGDAHALRLRLGGGPTSKVIRAKRVERIEPRKVMAAQGLAAQTCTDLQCAEWHEGKPTVECVSGSWQLADGTSCALLPRFRIS